MESIPKLLARTDFVVEKIERIGPPVANPMGALVLSPAVSAGQAYNWYFLT